MDQSLINKIGESMIDKQGDGTNNTILTWDIGDIHSILTGDLGIPIHSNEWDALLSGCARHSGLIGAKLTYSGVSELLRSLKNLLEGKVAPYAEFSQRVDMMLEYFDPNVSNQSMGTQYRKVVDRSEYKEQYLRQSENIYAHNQQIHNQDTPIYAGQFEDRANQALFNQDNVKEALNIPQNIPVVDATHEVIQQVKTPIMTMNNYHMENNNHQETTDSLNNGMSQSVHSKYYYM